MRRVIFELLICPRCQKGRLHPDRDVAVLSFGPLRCGDCHASFPVSDGIPNLVLDREQTSPLQKGLESSVVARSFERFVRPTLQLAIARRRFDRETEFLAYKSLLGPCTGPVLDIGCGTGLFARRLARDSNFPAVVGLDVSRAMLDEAIAQAHEAGANVDFTTSGRKTRPFFTATTKLTAAGSGVMGRALRVRQ